MKVDAGIPAPMGNGFKIFAHKVEFRDIYSCRVDTGIELTLSENLSIEFEPVAGVFILSHSIIDGRIVLIVGGSFEQGDHIANVWVVERNIALVRFLEKAKTGGRLIRGDAQVVKNCTEN